MWRRFRRRSLAPSRPAVHPEQLGLVLLSGGAIAGGIWVAVKIL